MLRNRQGWILRSCIGFLLIGCAPTTPTTAAAKVVEPPQLPAYVAVSGSQTIPQLIVAERQSAVTRNLELLTQLWAPEGRIIDGRSSANPTDDYVWEGRDAVLDRYVLAVFPNPPPPLDLDDLMLTSVIAEGDFAIVANGKDQWTFVRRDGRWWILELRHDQ